MALVALGCGRERAPDLVNGKQLWVEKCGRCHALTRAATTGTIGPNLDAAFREAREDGLGRETIEGVVREQIDNPGRNSAMPADLVTGDAAHDVAAYVAAVAGVPGEDTGALAHAGLAGASTGEEVFDAAGCGGCHTLAEAGSSSNVGPSLDDLDRVAREQGRVPPKEWVRQAILQPDAEVRKGFRAGVMPADFGDRLTPEQIDLLVEYLLQED